MRRLIVSAVSLLVAMGGAQPAAAQLQPPRAEAGLSMLMSPQSGSRIPQLMMGPMLNVTLANMAGGVLGAEAAMRFRADGQQLVICPLPPGVICDSRNVSSLTTAGLTFRRGFGARPLQEGATLRAGLGGAHTTLRGVAIIAPFENGLLPSLARVQKQSAVLDLGLGWIQQVGALPLRVEGRVTGYAPELANTRYSYGLQFGIAY